MPPPPPEKVIHTNTYDNGRTLLETLAVLSIVGMLILGAMAGFSWAMRKARVENNLKEINLIAVDIFSEPVHFARTKVGQGLIFRNMNTSPFVATKVDEKIFSVTSKPLERKTCLKMYDQAQFYPLIDERTFEEEACVENKAVFYYKMDNGVSAGTGCGAQGVWNEVAGRCCPVLVEPQESPCRVTVKIEASEGKCPSYDEKHLQGACGTNGYCNNGNCVPCPAAAESCAIEADINDENACLSNKKVVCSDDQVCSNNKCICKGLKVLNEQTGKCECSFVPLNGNEETCECDYPLDLIDGACVQECPAAIGMTGFRDENGNCLCDTNAGYEEISIDNTWCNCDNNRYYWNEPEGTCMTCVQTTKEWARNRFGDSSSINRTDPTKEDYMIPIFEVDSESINEDVWYCGLTIATSEGKRVYNPSTKTTCEAFQVLVKDGTQFKCEYACGDEWFGLGKEGDRGGSDWTVCRCGEYFLWDGTRCVPPCTQSNYKMIDGQCIPYSSSIIVISLEEQITYPTNHCRPEIPAWTAGSSNFNYYTWKENTPSTCHAAQGYSVQSDDEASPCHWSKGCLEYVSVLPSCSYGEQITENCICPTGGEEGEYCCSSAQIKTSTGCVTCPNNSIPNQTHDECVVCRFDEVPSLDRTSCQKCPTGQIPNRSNTKCYACPTGTEPDDTGTACITIS